MYFDFHYDSDAELDGLIIRPDISENPDELHNYSQMLKVRNPEIRFAELAKMGKFSDYNKQDYFVISSSIKEFDRLFFKKQINVNVFQLLADMAEYILGNYCFSSWEKEDISDNGNKTANPKAPWD